MGFGWLLLKDNEATPIAKFFKSSIGWPSSTRMELLAVVSIVSVLNKNSKVTLYTDSANVISKFDLLKKETIFRRKRKTPNYNLWDILFLIINKLNIELNFVKVKAHAGDCFNEMADYLAKRGTTEPRLNINNKSVTFKANLAWLEHSVDIDPRKFVKSVNNFRSDIKRDALNRMKEIRGVDKKLMMGFINYKDPKDYKGFMDLTDDKIKTFRLKKMFNELPVLSKLKTRNPKIYKSDICPRCSKDKETISHLWKCDKSHNEMVILCNKMSESFKKILRKAGNKFHHVENMIEDLFPFGKTNKLLADRTEQRANFYKRFDRNKYKLEFKYIWDNRSSIDGLLRGRIPFSIINILRSYLKKNSKKTIISILYKWIGKIDRYFFDKIWKPRNDDILAWEEKEGITRALKRGCEKNDSFRNKGLVRKINKIAYSGKKKFKVHALDEELALYVRNLVGFNLTDFHLKYRLVEFSFVI